MMITDAQVHIWAADSPERPWLPGREPHRATPLTAEDLVREMDAAGVSRVVLIPPSWDCDRNDLVLAAANRYPDRFRAMGRPDLRAPDVREQVANWCRQPGMIGMRVSLTLPEWSAALARGELDWLWDTAQAEGIPVALLINHAMVEAIDAVAARYPGLKLALCHMALVTGTRDEEAFRDFDRLPLIARRPNVNVKVSAVPAYTSDPYPYRRLHRYLRQVYDAFGPRRLFWGTDLARLPCTYRQAVTLFTEELPWLSAADREWIMGRGLCEWLGWQVR